MSPPSNRSLHWEEFHRDCRTLCQRLADQRSWTRILAVTRGGLIPAGIIARELDLREIQVVCVKSYENDIRSGPANRRNTVQFLSPVPSGDGSDWLIVDDLADTGATIRALRERLPRAYYAAVYTKPEGRDALDCYVQEVPQNCWLNFPWDLESTYATPIAEQSAAPTP
jgi:xanthine phosphoribosyltransferase